MQRIPTRQLVAGSWLTVALALAACGRTPGTADPSGADPSTAASAEASQAQPSGDGEPQPGTVLTACEIITPADVEAAVGADPGTVGDGELTEDPSVLSPSHTTCRYLGDWGGVIVALTPEDGANLYDAAAGAYDPQEDLGLGDGAFWAPNEKRAFVWQGSVTAMLQIGFADTPAEEWGQVAHRLGEAMLGRL